MEWLIQTLISNLLIATMLALGAFICGKIPKLESLAYGLWILFFIKLVTPSWINVDYLYSGNHSESGIQNNWQIFPIPATTSQHISDLPEFSRSQYISMRERAKLFGIENIHSDNSLPHFFMHPRKPGGIRNPENMLIILWAVGVIFMIWIAFRRIRNFRRLVGMADTTGNQDIQSRVDNLAVQCGLSRIPKTLIYSFCLSPGIAWTPRGYKLLIPSGFWATLNDEEKDLAILHELGHLKRGDCLRRILEIPMMITFWWCPFTWLASRELRRLEELLCDRWVQKHASHSPEIYAGLLVNFLEYFSGEKRKNMPDLLCGLACRGLNNHKKRISLILENRRPAFLTRSIVYTCLGLACIISIPVSLRPQNDPPSTPPASIPLNENEDHKILWEPVMPVSKISEYAPQNLSPVPPQTPDSPAESKILSPDNSFDNHGSPDQDLVFGVQSIRKSLLGDWSWRNPDHPSDYAILQFLPHNALNIENNELPQQKGTWSVDGRNVSLLIEGKLALNGVYRDGCLHFDMNQESIQAHFVFTKIMYKPVIDKDVDSISPENPSVQNEYELPVHQLPTQAAIPVFAAAPENAVTTDIAETLNDFLFYINKELAVLSDSFPQLKGISLSTESHVMRIHNDDDAIPGGSLHPVSYKLHYISKNKESTDWGIQTPPFRFFIQIFLNQQGRAEVKLYMAGENALELHKPFSEILDAATNILNRGNLDQLFP